jgi:hypothetical protein
MGTETRFTESVNFYCTAEMRAYIQKLADADKISRTEAIRALIQRSMDSESGTVKRTRVFGTGWL